MLRHDLRDARRSSGIGFERFARLVGYSVSHLRSVENGNRELTADIVHAYDRVLATAGAFSIRLAAHQAHAAATHRPWNQHGTLETIDHVLSGSTVDRRTFATASGGALAALAAHWQTGLSAHEHLEATGSRQVNPRLVDHIDQRLEHLRHLDDEIGSGELSALARNELALTAQLLRVGSYTDTLSRRLYSLACEAGRQAAWSEFDQHHHTTAHRYFALALRASATANDPVAGAYTLSFMAVQCYSTGHAQQAVSLLEAARSGLGHNATALMSAMLAARSARAYSKLDDQRACARMLHRARTDLDHGPSLDEPPYLYWVTNGEIEMIAGSSALELGDPTEATRRFDAAMTAHYPGAEQYPRSHAIYMARAAEAQIALGDLDAAIERATHALRCLGGVDSARSTTTFTALKANLAAHSQVRVVRDFLDQTR